MKKTIKMSLAGTVLGMTLFASPSMAASYMVKPGDSLWKIATANGTTVTELKSWNGLSSDFIYPNQKLHIPVKSFDYITQSNDTMWIISNKFGIPLSALINANPQIWNPNNIWGGLNVHIPILNNTPPKLTTASTNLSDGRFPLGKGTYQPYTNSFAIARTWSPDTPAVRSHEGVDINAAKGTPVYSATVGKVIRLGWNTYGGWRVTIQADDSTVLYYAHLSKYAEGLKLGDSITKGQLLGYVGNTGYGPEGTEGKFESHLHFGMYKTDTGSWVATDPYPYLQAWEKKL